MLYSNTSYSLCQETQYLVRLANRSIFDTPDYSGTAAFTRAVSTLRRFEHMLNRTIEAWDDFNGYEDLLDCSDNNLKARWTNIVINITYEVSELRYLQHSLVQKIQTFDRMKQEVTFTERRLE